VFVTCLADCCGAWSEWGMERVSDKRTGLGAEPLIHQVPHPATLAAPRSGRSERHHFRGSEAVVFDFLNDQLPEPLNGMSLLSVRVLPIFKGQLARGFRAVAAANALMRPDQHRRLGGDVVGDGRRVSD
jgi:hypothetical protein